MSRDACPVCRSADTGLFYERRDVPIYENMVYTDRDAARRMPRGEMQLRCCPGCGFIFNSAFEAAKMGYNQQYDNTQTHSPAFRDHLERTVQALVDDRGVRDCTVVEVGCGKGGFIRRLVELDSGNRGHGFDPTYDGPLEDLGGRLKFERTLYGPECAGVHADVVVSRHMIEHVSDPVDLFRTAHGAMAEARGGGRIFIETRDVEWALRNDSVFDLVYEACSYFNAVSLGNALAAAGFRVESFRPVFNAQYLLLEAARSASGGEPSIAAGTTFELAEAFGRRIARRIVEWKTLVTRLGAEGPLVVWGAGAKGMTFANIVDPDCEYLEGVVDINPRKQGGFIPGTGHPIVAPARLGDIGPASVLVLNPNYVAEIEQVMNDMGVRARIIDPMSAPEARPQIVTARRGQAVRPPA